AGLDRRGPARQLAAERPAGRGRRARRRHLHARQHRLRPPGHLRSLTTGAHSADKSPMAVVDDLVFLQGVGATKDTLRRWNQGPWPVVRPWLAWSAVISMALLGAVFAVATIST